MNTKNTLYSDLHSFKCLSAKSFAPKKLFTTEHCKHMRGSGNLVLPLSQRETENDETKQKKKKEENGGNTTICSSTQRIMAIRRMLEGGMRHLFWVLFAPESIRLPRIGWLVGNIIFVNWHFVRVHRCLP